MTNCTLEFIHSFHIMINRPCVRYLKTWESVNRMKINLTSFHSDAVIWKRKHCKFTWPETAFFFSGRLNSMSLILSTVEMRTGFASGMVDNFLLNGTSNFTMLRKKDEAHSGRTIISLFKHWIKNPCHCLISLLWNGNCLITSSDSFYWQQQRSGIERKGPV